MGYVPQIPNLNSNLTMYENLYFGAKCFGLDKLQIKNNIDYLIDKLSLQDYLKSYDYTLSGGWQQRFMIARGLIHNPFFLILDEPTTGLDANIRKELWALIKELKKTGLTILLTTHYLEEAEELSDTVCILHKGEMKLIDSPKNLMNQFQQNKLEDVFLKFIKKEDL